MIFSEKVETHSSGKCSTGFVVSEGLKNAGSDITDFWKIVSMSLHVLSKMISYIIADWNALSKLIRWSCWEKVGRESDKKLTAEGERGIMWTYIDFYSIKKGKTE